jgi:hypothetical protein
MSRPKAEEKIREEPLVLLAFEESLREGFKIMINEANILVLLWAFDWLGCSLDLPDVEMKNCLHLGYHLSFW